MKWSDLKFSEALEFFRKKTSLTKVEWLALDQKARQKAFTVAGIASLALLDEVKSAVKRAIAKGDTLEDFKKKTQMKLEEEWQGTVANPGSRVEIIFRTNIQSAYMAGRWKQQSSPASIQERPYGLYSAIMDRRTTPVCRSSHGVILPLADIWWRTHYPPLHFQCRSTVIALSAEQARARGGTSKVLPQEKPLPGFGGVVDWEL